MAEFAKIILFDLHGTLVNDSLHLYRGIRACIEELSRREYRLAVVTTQVHERAENILRTAGVATYFQAIVGSDDAEKIKPAPDPIFLAISLLRGSSRNAIMIGDSLRDLQAGRAAGTRVAAALWGARRKRELIAFHPDCLLQEPGDLLKICL